MNRVAVFVDAGYLFAQGSALLSGQKRPRSEVEIKLEKVLSALEEFACRISGLPLLRIYWYDGTSTGPTPQHIAVAFQPRVKLRLGFVNTVGEQKGVDSLIVTDMISLARNQAMADAVLLSGDEDLRVGVQQAQEFGVRVHLLGITPCRGSQSLFLLQEADTTHEWAKADVGTFLAYNPRPVVPVIPPAKTAGSTPVAKSASAPARLEAIAERAAKEIHIDTGVVTSVIASYESTHQLPPQIDRPLLGIAKKEFGILNSEQKEELRKAFMKALKTGSRAGA
ncbi:MAG TPA: NYN domain-containing protein [Verrucomicrobiae bacterium]|jgi:hypothetical protein